MATLTATVDLPITASTVRDARLISLDTVAAWGTAVSREDLSLLLDDLTESVVARASLETSLVLELTLAGETLRVGLTDGSAVRPVAEHIAAVVPTRALAHRWGGEPDRGGHRVWFELVPPDDVPRALAPDPEVTEALADALRRPPAPGGPPAP
jgi:hypothetical protein